MVHRPRTPPIRRIATPIPSTTADCATDRVVEPTEGWALFRATRRPARVEKLGERIAHPIASSTAEQPGDDNPLIREWLKVGEMIRQERTLG